MTAVVYSTGAGYDDAGSSATPFCGAVSITSGQGVYAWISHNGSAPGLYKGTIDDGSTYYAMATLGTWQTPGGDTIAIAYLKAPSTISGANVRWTLRDAGDTTNVSVTGFDRVYLTEREAHRRIPRRRAAEAQAVRPGGLLDRAVTGVHGQRLAGQRGAAAQFAGLKKRGRHGFHLEDGRKSFR
jgi:hypothetical protein